jgi:hypothetical protein
MQKYNKSVSAHYTADDVLRPSYSLRRHDTKAGRTYAAIPHDLLAGGQIYVLPSVTTVLDAVVANDELVEWQMSMGKDRAAFVAERAAHYGTLMHIAFGQFMSNKMFALDYAELFVQQYKREHGIRYDVSDFVERLQEDLTAFAQWVHDYNVKPIAVEIPLANLLGYAGTIDLVAEIDYEEKGFFGEVYKTGDKKGLPKETTEISRKIVIVDFKSNRKTFHFANKIQVEGFYRNLWNTHLLGKEGADKYAANHSFLWRPSTTEARISYAFTEQTDPNIVEAGQMYLKLYKLLETMPADKTTTVIEPETVLVYGEATKWHTATVGEVIQGMYQQNLNETETEGPND